MSDSLEFTGERFTPECEREIWYEHYHRYALATRWCVNARTLDAACGEGYGSAMLAQAAASVEGVDISPQAIEHAREKYGPLPGVGFQVANCTQLPFGDQEFDRVVSFETLEHLAEQDELLAEFKRVLKPDGCLILSSPDKATYSDGQESVNEYHVRELYRDELEALIKRHFPTHCLLGQKLMFHSAIWSLDGFERVALDQVSGGKNNTPRSFTQAPMYYIALCAEDEASLPNPGDSLWLFDDHDESVYRHYHSEIRRHIAAGGIIADLEKEISELRARSESSAESKHSWWRRFLGKP